MRLWLLLLSAFAMCQAISHETPMEIFRTIAKSTYERVLPIPKTHSAVRLRIYTLTKNTDRLDPLKPSEYSLTGTLVSDAPPSGILRHLGTTKRSGREKANLDWVPPLVSQWQGEDYRKRCQAMLEIPSLADHSAWPTIRSALKSDALSLTARFALSEPLTGLFDADLPLSILQSMGKILLQGFEEKVVTKAQLQKIALILTKSEAIEPRDKANLAKHWVATLEGPTTDHGLGLSLFGLALQGQHATTIATIVEASDAQIDFEWLALARRQGNTKLVSDWILKDWPRFDWLHGPQSGREPRFRQGDEVPIPELKDHPDHATFAEALFLALPDAKEKAEPARAERLHAFAKRITEFPWKDSALEQATLALVGVEPDAARHLMAHYQRIGSRLQFSELHGLTNVRDRRCQQRLFQLANRFSLSYGPRTPRDHLETLLKLQDASARRLLQDLLLKNLENTFLSDWHLWTPEIFTTNLELLPLAIDLDPEGWLARSWTMRLLAKDESNLVLPARVRRAKPAPGADSSPKASFLRDVLTYLAQAIDKGALDKEARAEVAIQISQSPNFMRTLAAIPELERGWFRYLETEALLTKEALLEHAGAFAKIAPRNGWAWAEAAQIHAAANKQADALAHWNSALPFAGEDPLRYSTYQLGRLETLFKLGLHNDAGKAIKAFDQKRLHPDFRDRWEAAKKQLNVRPGAVAPVV